MSAPVSNSESRVAVLVDCDNVSPDILDQALLIAAQFGRIVLRRGYGNSGSLASRWQETLVRLAFTPCLQYQYAGGKNTADIALALDALEAHFDGRVDTFCLVTSDSDFAYLCRKLRERGATLYIVGESKTPDALRNASDQFFESAPRTQSPEDDVETAAKVKPKGGSTAKPDPLKQEKDKPISKRRPRFVVEAVTLLAGDTSDGIVRLSTLGQYLKRTDPAFSPKAYGHSGLLSMLKAYDLLVVGQQKDGHWYVSLATTGDS